MLDETGTRLILPALTARDHYFGSSRAPVTLVEYGDYACGESGRAHRVVKELQGWYRNCLRYVYRHFPAGGDRHSSSWLAAEAAEAAGAQGLFWEMHDHLFEHQQQLDPLHLKRYAAALRLDVEQHYAALAAGKYRGRVERDHLGGLRCGVRGTPTFFINGVRHAGECDLDDLLIAVEDAAHAAREV